MLDLYKASTFAATEFNQTVNKKASLRITFLLTLTFGLLCPQLAQAQNTFTASIADMITNAPGGVPILPGLFATAEVVTTGDCSAAVIAGTATGTITPGSYGGGPLNVGWDEANRPIGPESQATRLQNTSGSGCGGNNAANSYGDLFGFKISFIDSASNPFPVPVEYFYGADLDGSELKTSFAFNGDTFVQPSVDLSPTTDLTTLTPATLAPTWAADLGLTATQTPNLISPIFAANSSGGAAPNDGDHQVIFGYSQSLTDIVFLYGPQTGAGNNNSGVSPMTLGLPDYEVVKSAVVGAIQPDGTFSVDYTVAVENTGVVTLNSLSLMDNVATSLGANFISVTPPAIVNTFDDPAGITPTDFPLASTTYAATGNGSLIDTADAVSLEPGDSFEVTYTVMVNANGGGGFGNSVEAEATAVGFGAFPILERDDDGNEDNADNSVTIVPPAQNPSLAVSKISLLQTDLGLGEFSQPFSILVQNDGNVNLSDISILDDIETVFGDSFDPTTGITAGSSISTTGTAVASLNINFDGDVNSDDSLLLAGAFLAPGDSITIDFTAVFDGSVDNLASAPGGQLLNSASATGTPPGGGGPITPVSGTAPVPFAPEPGIGVVKSVTNIDVLSDDTLRVTYSIDVQNTGNVTLTDLSLTDDLSDANQLGTAFLNVDSPPMVTASTANVAPLGNNSYVGSTGGNIDLINPNPLTTLAPFQTYTVEFTVIVDPSAAGAPADLGNTATAGGTDPSNAAISDDSNTGTDDTGAPTGETPGANPNGPGSPTPLVPPFSPQIGVSKSAGIPTLNDDGTIDVPYTLLVENTGNVTLSDIALADDLNAQFNAAVAGAFTPSDATLTIGGVVIEPQVSVVMDEPVGATAVAPTADVTYAGDAANDDLLVVSTGILGVGDIIEVTFTVRLNPEAAGGTLENTATAGGADPLGNPVTDLSDGGADPAGNAGGPGVPTEIVLPILEPELGISKAAGTPTVNADGTIDLPYTLMIANTGNVDISNLSLVDDLETQFGTAAFTASDSTVTTGGVIVAPTVTLIADAPGTAIVLPTAEMTYAGDATNDDLFTTAASTLGVGDQIQITFTVKLNPAAAGMTLENTATGGGTDPADNPVADNSDSGSDPTTNTGGPGTPTPITLPALEPSLLVAKSLSGSPVDLGNGAYQVTYNFVIENDGNLDIIDLQLVDDLNAMINDPNPNNASVANAVVSYVSGTVVTPNASYTGTGVNNMLAGSDVFPVGATTELSLSFEFTPDVYFGPFNNTATVSGTDPLGNITEDNSENATAPSAAGPDEDIQSPAPFQLDIVPSTPITLGWISISDDLNGSATIEWQTATEVANAGFNIWVLNELGDWVQANASLIPSLGDSTSAQNYQFLSSLVGEEFMLVDVSVTGVEERHGPFDLNSSTGVYMSPKEIEWDSIQQESDDKQEQREQDRLEQLQDLLSQPQAQAELKQGNRVGVFMQSLAASLLSVMIPTAHAVDLVNFEVETAGLYQVTHQDLMAMGLDLRGVNLERLGLQEAGQLWPMDKQASGNVFTSNTTLLFPARGLDTLYSGVNKYTLVLDEGSLGIGNDDAQYPGNDIGFAYSYLAEATYAPQNTYSYLSPESEDSWFADALNAISAPAQKSVTLSVDGYVPPLSFGSGFGSSVQRQATQNPELEMSVWGGSSLPGNGVTNPDHQVLVELNGESVADIQFDGLGHELKQTPLVSVKEGNNVVEITVPNENGYLYDLIRLDHVSLRYPRGFEAQQNALVFESDWTKFRVSNLNTTNALVVRLDEDGQAYYMTERDNGSCTTGCIYFAGQGASNSYFVATNAGLKTPAGISVAVDGTLASTPANFIIIAHPDFIDTSSQALEGYASEITGQYGSVDIVDVEVIYAAYSGGVVDAYAIKEYISDAYADRGTRHILLVGGDNYDYQDYSNSGAKSFIPSIYQPISNNVKSVPSDSSYVLVDDDLSPDLTISRLPVRTSAELDNLIAKRHNYLARSYTNEVLMAADEVDNGGYSFKSDVQSLISDHYTTNSVSAVYLDDTTVASARSQLLSAFNSGVSFASYFGHSSTDRWSISAILTGDDVASLNNAQSPAVVAQWGCWNTFYASPEHDSMAHRFLLEGLQGAVTVMGASSFTQADAEKRMAEYLSANLQAGMSIGDAVLAAKQSIYAATPFQIDVLLGWAVLGFDDMPVFGN